MAISTVSVIHQDLVDLIEGLEPRGDIGGGESCFRHIEYGLPEQDREFAVGEFESPDSVFFGVVAEQDYASEFDVILSHRLGLDQPLDNQRRSEDVSTIQQYLEATSNYPTGVSLIRLRGTSKVDGVVEDDDQEMIIQTTLRFGINYSLASVGV